MTWNHVFEFQVFLRDWISIVNVTWIVLHCDFVISIGTSDVDNTLLDSNNKTLIDTVMWIFLIGCQIQLVE